MTDGEAGWSTEATLLVDAPPEAIWALVADVPRHQSLAGWVA